MTGGRRRAVQRRRPTAATTAVPESGFGGHERQGNAADAAYRRHWHLQYRGFSGQVRSVWHRHTAPRSNPGSPVGSPTATAPSDAQGRRVCWLDPALGAKAHPLGGTSGAGGEGQFGRTRRHLAGTGKCATPEFAAFCIAHSTQLSIKRRLCNDPLRLALRQAVGTLCGAEERG
ncbi:hypothetical protein D3C79_805240 [compost metagenome]